MDAIENELNRQQACEELGITFGALRQLLSDMEKARKARGVPMPRKGSDNGWRFNAEDMAELRLANTLAQTKPHASVVRHLEKLPSASAAPGQQSSNTGAASEQHAESAAAAPAELAELVEVLQRLAQAQAGQAVNPEALAQQVSMVVGPQLVEALAAQTELSEKYARAAHQVGKLEAQLEASQQREAALAAELQQARNVLAAPARRSWLERLLGK